jgi:two-component system sensor histidine kinase UhpB
VLEESVTTPEARARITETRMLAHRTLRAVRNMSIDLRPSALDDLGLLPALRWYIKEYQQKFNIEVDFQSLGLKERLPSEMETVLYRIVQESLTNIAKHAQAHKVAIMLRDDGDAVNASIVDDGIGFDLEQLQRTPGQERGLGLAGMHERALLLNGSLNIEAQPGQGTRVKVHIPIRHFTPPPLSAPETQIPSELSL